jgi:thiamine biosynthesis lipoprotein
MSILPLICLAGACFAQVPSASPSQGEPAAVAVAPQDAEMLLATESQKHMGTEFTIQVYHPKAVSPEPALKEAFAKIAALDKMMTDYDPESELSKLGAGSPHARPVPVSPELWDILKQGDSVSRQTGGAFDLSVGPLTKLWRQSRRQKKMPDPARLEAALAAVGYQHIELTKDGGDDAYRVRLTKPNMRLDLGGIAQGYAADVALEIMQKHGFRHVLINASGDLLAGDAPPGKPGWKIGLVSLEPDEPPSQFVYLKNGAISTSGDAFQFVEVDGKRYSHIVDPATGLGVTTPMSVTVVAKTCTVADAFASALCVMGPEKSLELQKQWKDDIEALFIYQADLQVKTAKTPGWDARTATP